MVMSSFVILAERPTSFTGIYKGYKMWNTQETVPYFRTIKVTIQDSIATVVDFSDDSLSYNYAGPHNSGYRYVRQKRQNFPIYEFLYISEDSANVQIGEPFEQNYFFKRLSK